MKRTPRSFTSRQEHFNPKGAQSMMLQRVHDILLFKGFDGFLANGQSLSADEGAPPEDEETGLEGAARTERDYLRNRLREELGREPTDEELDEWLRRHTEGY
jgi:hypothetical protein